MIAVSIYAIRVGFALDTSTSLVGFYVDHLGWQWLYWQGAVIAPLMGLMVYLGTPPEPVNRDVLSGCRLGRHAAVRHRAGRDAAARMVAGIERRTHATGTLDFRRGSISSGRGPLRRLCM